MSFICFNCFLCDEIVNKIFNVEIDNNLTIGILKDKIKNV